MNPVGDAIPARLARSAEPVLLLGETGTGKTTLASRIHALSGRRGPFVERALPGMPDDLRHSLLLGHCRGAFTSADADHAGVLEQAHGGTLFLDEVGLVTPSVQEMLLAVLDGRPIVRLGDHRTRQADVRIVLATNSDPRELLASGRWRPDFYYRLGYSWVSLPPLRERREEIAPLAAYFLLEVAQRSDSSVPELSPEVLELFLHHPWPGNFRQLKAVCTALVLAGDGAGRPIAVNDVPKAFLQELEGPVLSPDAEKSAQVRAALHRFGGNKSAAARALGVRRQAVYRLLEQAPAGQA